MKKLCIAALVLGMPFTTLAGEAKVTWLDFNDYRDVHPANDVKGAYHKRVAKQFEKHMAKLAEQLPDGYTLNVTFDDIDLAGDSRMNMQNIRVIKPIYFPKLTISYQVFDKKGQLQLSEQSLVLKDMNFMNRIKRGREGALHYEKRLLNDWFEELSLNLKS